MCGCAGQNSVTFSSLSETEGYIAGQAWQVLLSFGLHSDVAENVGSSKREIRTSLPLGNITMCIFSPPLPFFCCLFWSTNTDPPWRHHHHAPPPLKKPVPMVAPAQQAALSPQPPEAALLLFCAFLHFQSVGWGASRPMRSQLDCADQSEAGMA